MRLNASHLLLSAACTAGLATAAMAGAGVIINEIRTDQFGSDLQEYFELKGTALTDLTGLTYVVIGDGAGGSGVIEAVIDLTGFAIPADGHFFAAEATFNDAPDPYGVIPDMVVTLPFENSDNVTHMLVSGFTGLLGDDLDTNDDGILDATPWISILDVIAIIEEPNPPVDTEFHYGGPSTIGPDGVNAPGHVYRCEVTGTWTIGRFELADSASAIDTPGDLNASCTLLPGTCGDIATGSCFVANMTLIPSPACDDLTCCNIVVALDPFCGDVDWDGFCVQIANANCAGGDPCGIPGTGSCFAPNGTLGCDDASCCAMVCTIDPDCCDIDWDQACVDLALANCIPPAGDWVINEIHADPAPTINGGDANGDGVRDSSDDEFVEIYNNSGAAMDIGGWSITDAVATRHVFPSPTIIADQCAVLVFGGGVPTGVFGNTVVQIASTGSLILNNSGDTVTLLDNLSTIVTLVGYGNAGAAPSGSDVSITRDPDVTGFFVTHPTAGTPDVNTSWSPGTQFDGSNFPGCIMVPDMDMDGVEDALDNCPTIPNPFQEDCDSDGVGDVCEDDLNLNGVPDDCEIAPPTGLFINEIRIDQPGSDVDEYFELRSDTPGQSLDQLTYIVIGDGPGGSGTIESVTNLTGNATDANGFFVVAENTFSLGLADLTAVMNFEQSDNVTHMLVVNFFGALDDDIDVDDDGVIDNPRWLAVVDDVALVRDIDLTGDDDGMGGIDPENDEQYYSLNVVGPVVFPTFNSTPGQAYRCSPDDIWTIGVFDPFDIMVPPTDTPGFDNLICTGGPTCLGDVTDSLGVGPDGEVNVFDLLAVLSAWGPCVGCPEDFTDAGGIGPDGDVNVFDLLAVLAAWGTCP